MKRAKRLACLLLAAGWLLAASGCEWLPFTTLDQLMRPPKPADPEARALLAVLEKDLREQGRVQFLQPSEGPNRGAVTFADLDADGSRDAVVFYNTIAAGGVQGANFMAVYAKRNGKWENRCSTKIDGEELLSLEPLDLKNDRQLSLLVCWRTGESRYFQIYEAGLAERGGVSALFPENRGPYIYSKLGVADLTGNGRKEIACVLIGAGAERVNRALLYALNKEGRFGLAGETTLDPGIYACQGVAALPLANGREALLFDGDKSSGMVTEALLWDPAQQALSAPLHDEGGSANTVAYRNLKLPMRLASGGGLPEIPAQYPMEGSEIILNGNRRQFFLTRWFTFDEAMNLRVTADHIIYLNTHQWVQMPAELAAQVTAYSNEESVVHFLRWNGKRAGEELFWMHNAGGENTVLIRGNLTQAGREAGINIEFLLDVNETQRTD
ncbi:MAG: hypothetical protein LBG83_02100 [Oscillospiraceae bacterium]|jgi:hypothetical protein|nr:hypothetical protein [Oscillospiraceae bacterium]